MKSGLTLGGIAACVVVLGAAVVSGCGGGTGKVEQQPTLSPECGAAINAFRPRVMTAARYSISGSQTGRVFVDLYVRTVQGASTSEVNSLVHWYSIAVEEQKKAAKAAMQAEKTYAARRARCTITRDTPVACRNVFRLMQSWDAYWIREAIPNLKTQGAVLRELKGLLRTDPVVPKALELIERLEKLTSKGPGLVKKNDTLSQQYVKALENCSAGS